MKIVIADRSLNCHTRWLLSHDPSLRCVSREVFSTHELWDQREALRVFKNTGDLFTKSTSTLMY